jgi:hypothetical protein
MKNMPLNLIVNLQNKFTSNQKTAFLISKRVGLIVVFTILSIPVFGQTTISSSTKPIMEVNTYISSLKTMELNATTSFSNAENLLDLLNKIQPSTYFYSGVEKTYGDKPRNLYTDNASLSVIPNSNLIKNDIEIAFIKISNSNLSSTIDLSVFSSFAKLKYIYLQSNNSITDQDISKMIINYDERFNIFYKVDKGE